MMVGSNTSEPFVRPWSDLLDSGLLWLINTSVLHPRGWSMEPVYEARKAVGWRLRGNGRDPIQYTGNDTDVFARVQSLLNPADEPSYELVRVNDELRKFGIEYPLGARGVADLISMVNSSDDKACDQIHRLMSILRRMVDHENDPCELDHHGSCQTHNSGSPCITAVARRSLAEMDITHAHEDREW